MKVVLVLFALFMMFFVVGCDVYGILFVSIAGTLFLIIKLSWRKQDKKEVQNGN